LVESESPHVAEYERALVSVYTLEPSFCKCEQLPACVESCDLKTLCGECFEHASISASKFEHRVRAAASCPVKVEVAGISEVQCCVELCRVGLIHD
jgi:hypothetical protein